MQPANGRYDSRATVQEMFKFGIADRMHPAVLAYLAFHNNAINEVGFATWRQLSQVINQCEDLALGRETKLVMADCVLATTSANAKFKLWLLEADYVVERFRKEAFTLLPSAKLPPQCTEKNEFLVGKLLNILMGNHLKDLQDGGASAEDISLMMNAHMVFMRREFTVELQKEAYDFAVNLMGVRVDLTMMPLE